MAARRSSALDGEKNRSAGDRVLQTGPGIAREIGDRRGEGIYLSNLGLAYADQGETHGGSITVESRVGQGTAFTISIPMK